jgi:hypothetical protein
VQQPGFISFDQIGFDQDQDDRAEYCFAGSTEIGK